MSWLRFGTLSVGALTTTILLGLITCYLLSRRGKPPEEWYLSGYLLVIFLLTLSYAVRYSVFSPSAFVTGQISNLIVFGVVSLIQFAYHYRGNLYTKESERVLAVSLTIALLLWVSLFFKKDLDAVYDFNDQYFLYEYGPRIGIFTLPGFLWASIIFFRNARAAKSSADERSARSNRSFAVLTLITAVLPLFYLLFQVNIISRTAYNLIFNSGSLLICIAIFTVYLNNSPLPTSYVIKMTGIPLVVVLAAFGITSNTLMPVIQQTVEQQYSDDLAQTRFALESGYQSLIPTEAVFIIPVDSKTGAFEYFSDKLTGEEIYMLETKERIPGPFYLDLQDTASFYLSYTVYSRSIPYLVGFPYQNYRNAVHSFVVRIVIIVCLTTLAVILAFPFFFRLGLLRPLQRLLNGVSQVSSGNFRLELPVQTEDEMGQLARGFNSMVGSLKNAEGNFKALAENASDAILIISSTGRILFANTKAVELFGYSFGDLMSIHVSSLVPAEILPEITNRSSSAPLETRAIHADGHWIPVETAASATIWQDIRAEVVIIRDISERKKTEEALRAQQQQLMMMDKMASLGALVAGVAHEVNNPNQAISMNLNFMNEGLNGLFTLAESEEQADSSMRIAGLPYTEFKQSVDSSLIEIGDSTRRIDHIVKELKRLVRGGSKPEFKPVSLNEVVQTVIDLSNHMIHRSTNHFKTELASNLPIITADRISLEQVVLNLLQNACQALTAPENEIRVRTFMDAGSDLVCLEVIDQGRGIREEDLPKLTDSFFTTRSESGGTGLGLSVSARIIREHSGELSFSCKQGTGTTATVKLPTHPRQHLSSADS